MKWIESNIDLADHPKLKRLARALDIGTPAAIGHLHLLWWWAVRYAPDGELDFEQWELEEAARWDGQPGDLITALCDAGFIDQPAAGVLVIHDWNDHAGKATQASQRKSHAGSLGNHIRWHLDRGIVADDCEHCTGSSQSDQSESHTDRSANPTAQHSTAQHITAADPDRFQQLCYEVAQEQADERTRDGYEIKSRARFIAKLQQAPEVKNEARRRLGVPSTVTDLLQLKELG